MVTQIINKLKIMKKDINKIISRLDRARGCIKYNNSIKIPTLDEVYKNRVGTFMWAVEQMKQGKNVRRKCWDMIARQGDFTEIDVSNKNDLQKWTSWESNIESIEATDWEIYEENKFGIFKVLDSGHITSYKKDSEIICSKDEFDDLERAIKRARELK